MNLIDPKARKNIGKYALQCLFASIAVMIILLFFNILKHTAIIASLGATTFIVFTMPRSYPSRERPLLGGYFIGILVGILFFYISSSPLFENLIPFEILKYIMFGALSVGVSIFLMVLTDAEHPPASGIALGLVINEWDYRTILFIVTGVLILYVVKRLLKNYLINLR